ncbi:DUF4262 domain-containing protein [Mycobacterium sp.]|uniref:DUF4262 domain-containing protein n=1 Tax=Mycobacterium sp. TaxID=1785 RepID=UPI002D9799EC|nr:DUF4262 domain-containing protein [Mycobacterium sp.]
MCWQCDNPDRPIQEYFDELRETIRTHGWVVQFVEDDRRPFAYTIGLHDRGLPELVVTGMPSALSALTLNAVARGAVDGIVYKPGDHIEIEQRMILEVVEVEHPDAHLNFAIALAGPQVRALQLVWADERGRWPWDARWSHGRRRQPVLGVRHPLRDAS